MNVETVLGPTSVDRLGMTLIHEHIFHDLTVLVPRPASPTGEGLEDEPVSLSNLWWCRLGGWNADNFIMDDVDLAIREVGYFGEAGGRSMAELTPRTMGRNVDDLAAVAQATGVNIIASSGYASGGERASIEEQVEEYVRELNVGIDGSGVRAGVLQLSPLTRIGITSLEEMAPVDIDGIRATAQAQRLTGVGLSAEPPPSASPDVSRAEIGLGILEKLLDEGVSPERIAITTLDGNLIDLADRSRSIRRIADTGAFIQLGLWGAEPYQPMIPGDGMRMQMLSELIKDGYAAHILFGHDIATKMRLRSYGGRGYAHIVGNVRHWLVQDGIQEDVLQQILIDNPKRFLTSVTD